MEVIHVKKNLRRRWAIPNSYGLISSYAVCKAPSIFSVAITVFLVLRSRSGLFQSSISACTVYATTAACVSSRCCCRGCCGCKISPQQSWRFYTCTSRQPAVRPFRGCCCCRDGGRCGRLLHAYLLCLFRIARSPALSWPSIQSHWTIKSHRIRGDMPNTVGRRNTV